MAPRLLVQPLFDGRERCAIGAKDFAPCGLYVGRSKARISSVRQPVADDLVEQLAHGYLLDEGDGSKLSPEVGVEIPYACGGHVPIVVHV